MTHFLVLLTFVVTNLLMPVPSPFGSRGERHISSSTYSPACQDTLSSTWPPEIQQWKSLIKKWANQYCMDPDLIASVMTVESNGKQYARSRSGALGLMQIMPKYHSCATYDSDGNIGCGTHILATYYHRAGDDWRAALAAYYAGETGRSRGLGWDYADLVTGLWTSHP